MPKEQKEQKQTKKPNNFLYPLFFVFVGLFTLKVPKYLSQYSSYILEHKEIWYCYLVVVAIILVALKIFYLKKHNWDTFLTVTLIGLIIGTLLYNFLNVSKHFEGESVSKAYYLWESVFFIPIIIFFLIDKTDYSEMIEFENKLTENEDKIAERRHKRYMKRREKNPYWWHKSKTNKIICDTIVYVVVILCVIIGCILFINHYRNFEARMKAQEEANRDFYDKQSWKEYKYRKENQYEYQREQFEEEFNDYDDNL